MFGGNELFARWGVMPYNTPIARFRANQSETSMTEVIYNIVEHDGGWAYKVGDVFSEAFPTHAEATAAAKRAAVEQTVPGRTEVIQFEDEKGKWHEETARGSDRPTTGIVDKA